MKQKKDYESYYEQLAQCFCDAVNSPVITGKDVWRSICRMYEKRLLTKQNILSLERGCIGDEHDYDFFDEVLFSVLSYTLQRLNADYCILPKVIKKLFNDEVPMHISVGRYAEGLDYDDSFHMASVRHKLWHDRQLHRKIPNTQKSPDYFEEQERWVIVSKPEYTKRQTYKLSPYLRVKKSTIPKAGNGLFATRDLPAGLLIGYYCGEYLRGFQLDRRYTSGRHGYVLRLSNDFYIDGLIAERSNVLRYMNDPLKSGKRANVKFTPNGGMILTCNVSAGDELLVHYGRRYWAGRSCGK